MVLEAMGLRGRLSRECRWSAHKEGAHAKRSGRGETSKGTKKGDMAREPGAESISGGSNDQHEQRLLINPAR